MDQHGPERDGLMIPRWFLIVVAFIIPSGVAWCSWVSLKIVEIGVRMEQHSNLRADFVSMKADLDVHRSGMAKIVTEIELLKMKTLDMPRIPQ